MSNTDKAKLAAVAATENGTRAAADEATVQLIAKIKQKNGLTFKLIDAIDINWDGFDWTGVNLPTYTPTPASATAAGVVKIGGNISVTADGTISVSKDNVNAALGYTAANAADVTTLQGYFDDDGSVKTFGGHTAGYYATTESVQALQNGMRWQSPVADTAALKAVAGPKDTEARITEDTNTIYIFDAENKATADAADGSVIVATDKTAGAWVKQGTAIYSPATSTVDGLMAASDKAALDKAVGDISTVQGYFSSGKAKTAVNAEQLGGKAASEYATKDDLANIPVGIFFATTDVQSDSDVALTSITVPDGQTVGVGAKIIDNKGDSYTVTAVTAASGDTPASVHVSNVEFQFATQSEVDAKVDKVTGKGLSTNDYTTDEKNKLSGLANVKKVGSGLALAADGTLTAPAQEPDLSAYQTTAQADAKYATKADVDVVSEDFINSLFATA